MTMKKRITVIGPNAPGCKPQVCAFGEKLGRFLADRQFIIINGGRKGFMEAVFKGARTSPRYVFGQTVCLLPGGAEEANPYCDIPIPTGLGLARNYLIANSSPVVIAVAGGAGTLSEMAYAWQLNKTLIAFTLFEGWAKELAGKRPDSRRNDYIIPVGSLDELDELLRHLYPEPPNHLP